MPLPINIEDLLNKRRVESNRIEFKLGWNPTAIYRSICAFANDIDNIGGGYIIIGVEEKDGVAQRPVAGLPESSLDKIQREIHRYNQQLDPGYVPRLSVEEVDGRQVLVIWAATGHNRPYAVPSDVTAKVKKPIYYVRYGTSTIEAKDELLDQLRDMVNRVPFDDRGNEQATLGDLSPLLLKDHLTKVGSRLAEEDLGRDMERVLDQMNLLDGPKEQRRVKNVAVMMFCEQPERFFPTTQVDIVMFREGRVEDPDNFIEAPPIKGPVPMMIQQALSYLRTNVVKERVRKRIDDEHSDRFFNYPYQALEEAVVNALYHRDYREREPVEITVEPDRISILSYSGPDRSISMEAIHAAQDLRSRRYRNRRLGEFLKELGLTEGRATGIPSIQRHLKDNGSPRATITTDDDRTFFLIDIPCHLDFINNTQEEAQDDFKENHIDIERVAVLISKKFQRNFKETSKKPHRNVKERTKEDWQNMALCLQRCQMPVSAQVMLLDLKNLTYRQSRSKYLLPLLEMGLIEMTIPDQPTNRNQKYILTEKGRKIIL